jgi:hypothetical protein
MSTLAADGTIFPKIAVPQDDSLSLWSDNACLAKTFVSITGRSDPSQQAALDSNYVKALRFANGGQLHARPSATTAQSRTTQNPSNQTVPSLHLKRLNQLMSDSGTPFMSLWPKYLSPDLSKQYGGSDCKSARTG